MVWSGRLTSVRSGADADVAFSRFRAMPVRYADEAGDLDAAWELARRYDEHPIYALVYLALADRLGETLHTADERLLARVAGRPNVVRVP